ncbi:MAG: GNAT family N-acetyltransferase [Bacteroides sp.]|nr:GNAT family N-acetyltransferase [Bacteroides sp.]MCM1549849.1 GNAT family N-acetyltransferase [Clostridium sp.]
MLETERLILREFTAEDFDALYEILSDSETMAHYPKPFDENEVKDWIQWNIENYEIYGFGLWAVVLKETGKVIGDCGITMQKIGGGIKPEIGYHINKQYWRKGYGSEAAAVCRDYIFQKTPFRMIYSYMKATNTASCATAAANGMRLVDEWDDGTAMTKVYAITRQEWRQMKQKK